MMPCRRKRPPTDPTLTTCIGKYRKQATPEILEKVWKNFRASQCGERWLEELHKAYGHRCLYCDHAEGGDIDHCEAKSASLAGAFEWKNHRPSCASCNRDKGTKRVVDPVTEDPRVFLVFDVNTGKPDENPSVGPGQRAKARDTLPLLDKHTLKEARRAKVRKVVDTMRRFLAGDPGYDVDRVLAELAYEEPHRAIVRDLILDAEEDLHRWAPLVREVVHRIPDVKAWALAPRGRRGR